MGMDPQLVPLGAVSRDLGLSPTRIRELTEAGVFSAERSVGGHRRYDLDATRNAWLRHKLARAGVAGHVPLVPVVVTDNDPTLEWTGELAGLAEDEVWQELGPQLGLGGHPTALAVTQYVFTEMLNNAIDHSGGTQAWVRAWSSDARLVIEIRDNGVGVFQHLVEAKDLPNLYAAVQELTKGKQTTAPERHSGEGIFFSSKAVDLFSLAANGIVWTVDNLRVDHAVGESRTTTGTVVRLEINPRTGLDLGSLFRQFTDDTQFTRTRPVVKLFSLGVRFVSRSEAKRLLAGLEQFTEIEVDFTGVESVGQGFVDELFRVWPQAHPMITVTPTNMNASVNFMVTRGLP